LNFGRMTNGAFCFGGGVKLSVDSYSNLLINIADLNRNTGVTFSGGLSRYSASGVAARNTLTSGRGWVITDGGSAANSAPTVATVAKIKGQAFTILTPPIPRHSPRP
jgi:hypothetical protein